MIDVVFIDLELHLKLTRNLLHILSVMAVPSIYPKKHGLNVHVHNRGDEKLIDSAVVGDVISIAEHSASTFTNDNDI